MIQNASDDKELVSEIQETECVNCSVSTCPCQLSDPRNDHKNSNVCIGYQIVDARSTTNIYRHSTKTGGNGISGCVQQSLKSISGCRSPGYQSNHRPWYRKPLVLKFHCLQSYWPSPFQTWSCSSPCSVPCAWQHLA